MLLPRTNDDSLMEQDPRKSEEQCRLVVSKAPIMLFAINAAGIFTLLEGQGLQMLGLRSGELVGLSAFDIYRDHPQLLATLHRAFAGEAISIVHHIRDVALEIHYIPYRDAQGMVDGVMGVATEVFQQVRSGEIRDSQILYDSLTGLPNRLYLQAQLEQMLTTAKRTQGRVAFLLLNLNRFKEINDTFGRQHADRLLQQVGERLLEAVRSSDTVARLSGDMFAILLPMIDEAEVCSIIQRLQGRFQEPYTVMGLPVQIETRVGISVGPEHGKDVAALMRCADIAIQRAKRVQEGYAFYNANDDAYNPQRLQLIGSLRDAISNQGLQLYYQPKADLKTGLVHAVEALARWNHPQLGFIPPDQFIPLAEQTGLIAPLTFNVLEQAIRQCRDWRKQGLDLKVAINLSMENLRDTKLPERIAALLKQYGVPGRMLCVEVTESMLMIHRNIALAVLQRIFNQGILISIDDFGTGYSSLAYLKHLPADELKIDRTFIQHVATTRADMAIVRSTVIMAHSLGLHVVAEGVEDQETWDLLTRFGCDTAQGYYLSRPIAAPELEKWLQKTKLAMV